MPKKFFRKYLPDHESVRTNRYVARLGPWIQHPGLWCLNRRTVAGGVAAGLFAGLIPGSNPVQFLAGSLLAIAFRVNLPLAVFVTLYSNPFTIVPLYYCAFKLGELALLRRGNEFPDMTHALEAKGFSEWWPAALEWLRSAGTSLLVGLPLLAILLAIVGYFVVDWTWRIHVRREWRRRHLRRVKVES